MLPPQLVRFWNVFPREQVKVILYDDLVKSPSSTIRELYDFVGVGADVELNPRLHANATRTPDDDNLLHRFVNGDHWARATVRKLLPVDARQRLREAVRQLLFTPPPQLSLAQRRQIQPQFTDEIKQLQELLGRDLSAWLK